ncbi:MAG: hypothetical protein QOF70_1463 [Acetobacteraceae bacterium]|jgi:hypothetical protein|nr:hypothetical protein [Acetobacteraceae bacterium]
MSKGSGDKADRAAREAAALRANLLKRKEQARLREAVGKDSGDEAVETVPQQDGVEIH